MIGILGLWEIGYNTPLVEMTEWEHMLREFDVDKMVMSPVSGIRAGVSQSFLEETDDVPSFLDRVRTEGTSLVFVDEFAETTLRDFVHPENCYYVFGRSSSRTAVYRKPEDKMVKIETITNKGGFWAHQACSIVLYDRFLKVGV